MNKNFDSSSPIATIFGGSGFVGRYIVRRLVKSGWRVRAAVRYPNQALFLKTYGEVGQVEILQCSIFDRKSLQVTIPGSKVVINAVAGLLNETVRKKFKQYYIEGPGLIAEVCSEFSVESFIHISSVGVDKNSRSLYSSSKAKGEERVIHNFPNAIIIRPSLIFGHEDRFFNRYASMACYSLIVPLVGQNTKFQPVYVDDIAKAIESILIRPSVKGIFELGGPEVLSFNELVQKTLLVIRRKRLIVSIPFSIAKLMAITFELVNKVTFGLIKPAFTTDNVEQLKKNNIVGIAEKSFKDLYIKPQAIDTIIPLYLYSFRQHGQYHDLTKSSKTLE
jgi:NADH dehydrogenase